MRPGAAKAMLVETEKSASIESIAAPDHDRHGIFSDFDQGSALMRSPRGLGDRNHNAGLV
ncbi:hypothetical protein D9M69_679710 [compost metagenome]